MKKYFYFISASIATFFAVSSCGDDDGIEQGIPPRSLSEVAPENDAEIREYLSTHFYNYEQFENPREDFDFEIVLDTIAGANSGKRPLLDDIEILPVTVNSEQFQLDDEEEVVHNLYFLKVSQGDSIPPTIGDSTLLRYTGMNLQGEIFDRRNNFVWFELPNFIRGFAYGASQFNSSIGSFVNNNDGTINFPNSGRGVLFIPSGLGYYNGSVGTLLPAYSPAIFKIEVARVIENTDTDGDGIPNIFEDVNGDGDIFDDNTDEDDERARRLPVGISNFRDTDDDGDGVPTREEISMADGTLAVSFPTAKNPNIVPDYPDEDKNGIPDYLDKDYQRTVFDKNN